MVTTAESIEPRERVLALEGGRNFRDLGGYETRDGRRLRWGKLYRSGLMSGLTPADYDVLASRGVRFICDLRTNSEREESPTAWERIPNLSYWSRDYAMSFGDLRRRLVESGLTIEGAQAAMVDVYRRLPFEQAPSYSELFKRIAAGEVPLIFNCSAGKDRTGVAAALILSALGVPEETILDDFLLTNTTLDRLRLIRSRTIVAELGDEVAMVILSVEPEYIHTCLSVVREAHGSVEAYLEARLGVGAAELARMRDLLLE
jgi:protein-tyrosine phosphatase